MSRNLFLAIAALAIAVVPVDAGAQPAPGVIAGIVRDASGAPVPGTVVRVVNERTGSIAVVVSDEHGTYRSGSLAAGPYRLETELEGFEPVVRKAALEPGQTLAIDVTLAVSRLAEALVITARRTEELAQEVPIPVSVVGGTLIEDTGAFNVNQLKDLVPTVQFYTTNPRNSAVNIRGIGAPFGLTNDGIEQGVGMYVDGVFYARPAAATLDFLDVERIEVLRGPQGTLFGKNTTAGAINVTTRRPSFTPAAEADINYGSFGFVQARGSITGPLSRTIAARASFSSTERGGVVGNTATGRGVNDLSNLGARGQVLFTPRTGVAVTLSIDHTRQRPEGFTQVVAGVAPTLRPPNRQYPKIAADLGYTAPSFNAFDRLTDVDSPLRSHQDMGGVAATLDWKLGRGQLTSTTAWRYWDWNPSNDRDFIGLPVTTVSAAPSRQRQWTQEVRYAGDLARNLNLVAGLFAFQQTLVSDPSFKQEQGSAAARFLLAPTPAAATPGLLDGYGFDQYVDFGNVSAAVFAQLAWSVTDRLRLLPGLRVNYDQKDVDFDQQVYGGLQTSDPALIALQRSIFAPQAYTADVADTNLSGQLTAAYRVSDRVHTYATYATGFKSVGLNLNGLPADALGRPILSTAVVKPEDERHVEVGIKTQPFQGVTANLTAFNTTIKDFQAQVVNADVGVLRGYLANADKVRVRGAEFDGQARIGRRAAVYTAVAYTDGIYVSFPDAPPPLEDTGGPQVKDISGSVLPGISKWAWSLGGEYANPATIAGKSGELFGGLDLSYRTEFSSSSSASRYLVAPAYSLLNARAGFRWGGDWALYVWSRNLLDEQYYELLTAAPGNTGLFVGQPGDGRSLGVTLRAGVRWPGN
jgi:iron complex outermembrane receptor protein